MAREYESEADRRDEEQQELESTVNGIKDDAEQLKEFADRFADNAAAPGQGSQGAASNTPSTENVRAGESSSKGPQELGEGLNQQGAGSQIRNEAVRDSSKEAGKAAGREAGKEAGKEVGKEIAKEGAKEGAKATAEAAAASTGVGLAVDAGVEALDFGHKRIKEIGEGTKKAAQEFGEAENTRGNVTAHKKRAQSAAEDNTGIKIVIAMMASVIGLVLIVVTIIFAVIMTLAAPVMMIYNGITNGWGLIGDAISYIQGEPSLETIAEMEMDFFKDGFDKAFKETCYNEVYQIALEQEYDIDLTMESYSNNKFPYILDGSTCNVNYLELMGVLSLSDRFDQKNFSFDAYKELFEDPEFLRCLYDLKVERAEMEIRDEDVYDEHGVMTHKGTGEVIDVIVYGEVTVGKYNLKKLMNYFGIDPSAPSKANPALTNYQYLTINQQYMLLYNEEIDWGSETTSKLYNYTYYTGEITTEADNIYADQIENIEALNVSVSNGVPLYAQASGPWAQLAYGGWTDRNGVYHQGNVANNGCCVTSFAMVASYMTGSSITPTQIIEKVNKAKGLVRDRFAKDYGFTQYISGAPFTASAVISEMDTGRILMAHVENGHMGPDGKSHPRGHWVVITGCDATGEEPVVYINDPAGGKAYEWPIEKAIANFDTFYSYGS